MASASVQRVGPWSRRAVTIVVPSALTALAFVLLSQFHLTGRLPLWALLIVLGVAAVVGEVAGRFVDSNATTGVLHLAIGAQCVNVAVIIYVIGWGPTLALGYLFVAARALDTGGSRTWKVTTFWAVVATAVGQGSIALGLVKTYVPVPWVHGLAFLGVLGNGFVIWVLGAKTQQNETASAARDRSDVELRSALSLLTATLDSTADGILVVDSQGKITQHNARFAQMWRLPAALLDDRDDDAALAFVLDQLIQPDLFFAKVQELYANPDAESDDILRFKDGRVFDRHSLPQKVGDEVVGRVWSFRDVTDHNRLLNELEHQAFHDSLTGLANRALLRDRLEHALARARRSAATVAVLFCDLDGFKMINDTLGHETGDLLLSEVAKRIVEDLREGDTAARLGGDEFAIVLDEIEIGDAVELAGRLLNALRRPFHVNGREILARASIGIADNSAGGLDTDSLLTHADIAMYAAKSSGRDCFTVFEPVMQSQISARHLLHGDLRHAILLDGALVVHYQPVLDLKTQRIDAVEALVRWNHPTRGLIPPDEFVPIAEETGLIVELGRFVLREACWQVSQWRARGAPDLSVSVNVSPFQLYDASFLSDVQLALHEAALDPTALVLELTERSLLNETAGVRHRLTTLRESGIRIAIDDFGTGYSSLSYLRKFAIDYLKIDRSFVSELGISSNAQGRALVRSIINIGHDLDLDVIAEGIENASQLDALRSAGCDFGQGYLFGRPSPAEEILGLVCPDTDSLVAGSTTSTVESA